MKLEMDLLRDLLLHIEATEQPIVALDDIQLDGWSAAQVAYHVLIAEEAGLIKADVDELPDSEDESIVHIHYTVRRLTANGHEFVTAVSDSKVWREAKRIGRALGGALTAQALTTIAKGIIDGKLKLAGLALSRLAE